MARRRRGRRGHAGAALGYAAARAGLGARYLAAKREYHRLGDALYKSGHGGRSSRRRRSRTRRSR